jgi:hypothetical protein
MPIVLASEMSEMAATALDLVNASLAPALVSVLLLLLLRRLSSPSGAGHFVGLAIAAAYLAGYAVWRHNDPLAFAPARNWPTGNWTLFLAPFAALVGQAAGSEHGRASWRLALGLFASLAAAWLLVPSWESLWPPRVICVPLLAAYFVALAWLVDRLADRIPASVLLGTLTLAAGGLSLAVTAMSSLSYGQLLAVAAAALAGCALVAAFAKTVATVRGLGLVYAILIGGWAFVAASYPIPPKYGYLLVPTAPLLLWGWIFCRSRM